MQYTRPNLTVVGMLELARQLGDVSQACRIAGYSRNSLDRFKEVHDKGGEAALQEISRHRSLLKNRVDPQFEAAVMELALELPACGRIRITSAVLKRYGPSVSSHGSVASGCTMTSAENSLK